MLAAGLRVCQGTNLLSSMVLVLVMVVEYDVQMLEQLRPACSGGWAMTAVTAIAVRMALNGCILSDEEGV